MHSALLLWLVASSAPSDGGVRPAALGCLERHYGATSAPADGGWTVRLPDGSEHPFDDGRVKTLEQRLASPDLEDTFAVPYRKGAIRPVTTPDDDPGRVRFEPLFRAAYGATPRQVDVVPFELFGQRLRVHRKVLPAFRRVERRLKAAVALDASLLPFLQGLGGTFVWRKIAGTDRQSAHSFGISIDLNVARSHYWDWQRPKEPLVWRNRIPQPIVDAFEAEGFAWGGRWFHYDTMHFEYRPELLDPACAPP